MARDIVDGVAIAAFPRRRNAECFRPIDMRKVARTVARITACFLFRQRFHYFFRSYRDFVNSNADGVVNSVGHGGHDGQKRTLADFLGAEGAAGIGFLDQLGDDVGHIERSGALVFQHGGKFVHQGVGESFGETAEFLLFHEGFAEAHVDAALDLTSDERRVESAADVVGDPDFWDGDPARHGIHGDIDDCGGIRIGGGWTDTAAFVQRWRFRGSVRANGADGAEASFGQADGFVEGHSLFRRGRIKNRFVGETQPLLWHFETNGDRFGKQFPGAFRCLQSGIAGHDGDAARIGAEVDRPQVRVAGKKADVEGVDAKNFGNDSSQDIVGALADFRGAAENGDAAAAVELELNSGLRHLVPVNGKSRPCQVSGTGEPEAAAFGQFPEFLFPVGGFYDAANAFGKVDSTQAEIIGRHRVGRFDDAEAQVGGVDFQFLSDFVELNFLTEAGLDGAMAAFWSARRFVGKGAATLETIARDVVGGGLQRTGIKSAGDAVGAVAAPIDQRLEMHSGDGAVLLDAGLEFHQDGMAAAMAIKNFFASETNLDGAVQQERGLGHDDFVIEGFALSAEASAIGRGADANMRWRHLQNLGKGAMKVVRGLSARPDGQLSIRVFGGDGGVLLDGEMRASLIEENVFKDFVGFGERFFNIAEFQSDALMNVALFAVLVDARFGSGERFFGIGDGGENFVLDVDEVQSFERGELLAGDDGSDGITDVAHMIEAEGLLVLADGKNPVLDGQVFPGKNQIDSGVSESAGGVDLSNAGVRMRGKQKFGVGHARKEDVVGEARLTGHFRAGVHPASRNADYAEFPGVGWRIFRGTLRRIFLIWQVSF